MIGGERERELLVQPVRRQEFELRTRLWQIKRWIHAETWCCARALRLS